MKNPKRRFGRKVPLPNKSKPARPLPALLVARGLWKRGNFNAAVNKIHRIFGISVNYVSPPQVEYYNVKMVMAHPELTMLGRDFARRSIDLLIKLRKLGGVRLVQDRKKYSPNIFKGRQVAAFDKMPSKKYYERIAGTKISEKRFRQMLRAESSRDLISKNAFELLYILGDKSDLPRLKEIIGDVALYNSHSYAKEAVRFINQRNPIN